MSDFAKRQGSQATPGFRSDGGPAEGETAPRFRLVDHRSDLPAPPDSAAPAGGLGVGSGIRDMISPRLLVDGETFDERMTPLRGARDFVMAEVPLITALARIRTDADAALALTGVLELLGRRFHIGLPCGEWSPSGDGSCEGFRFHAAKGIQLEDVASAIDEVLMGTVRATDLQGALRDRARARVTLED